MRWFVCLALGLAAAVTAAGAGCGERGQGAVVVRWRLIDPTTGSAPEGCRVSPPERGACCVRPCAALPCPNLGDHDVPFDTIRLHAVRLNADGGITRDAEVACPSCCFPCSPFEHTTGFELPPGTYFLYLEALRCGAPVGHTPPGVVRNVVAGEITNLNAVEVVIPADAVSAGSCGDGGVPACAE